MINKMLEWLGFTKPVNNMNVDVFEEHKKSLQLGYCENCGQPMYENVKAIKFDVKTGKPTKYKYILKCENHWCYGNPKYGFISKVKFEPELEFYLKHEFSKPDVLDVVDEELENYLKQRSENEQTKFN